MKRSVRPTATRAGGTPLSGATLRATIGLTLGIALATLAIWLLAGGVGAALASPAGATRAADGTPAPSPTALISVPTIGPGASTPVAPLAPAMSGATIAATLTCVTTVIGLVIAVVTLSILLRGGYGPFLRALIFGSRRRGKRRAADDDGGQWDASHTLNYRPGPDALDDPFAPQRGAPSRRLERNSGRGSGRDSGRASRAGRSERRAPSSSRRGDW